jgi:hypothetical protein
MAAPSTRSAKKRVDGADTTTQTANQRRKQATHSGIAQSVPRAVARVSKGMEKAPSTKKRKVGADARKQTAEKRHDKPNAKEKEEGDDWNEGEGFVWNEDELCTECLQVLQDGGGVHMGLAAPDPGTRTEPVGGPLEVGDEVIFDVGDDIVTGMLMRKQTFYQVAVAGASAGVVETYHTISVEQHEVRKAPTTSSSGPEVEKNSVWQQMLKHP